MAKKERPMSFVEITPDALTIDWDDSVVLVFSFQGTLLGSPAKVQCGFPHVTIALAQAQGVATNLGNFTGSMSQQIQLSGDPQTWIETVKGFARKTIPKITISYDDQLTASYAIPTTTTPNTLTLQQLYSIRG
jgi:hypothetical protein